MPERVSNDRDSLSESEEMMDFLSDQLEKGYHFHINETEEKKVRVRALKLDGEPMIIVTEFDIWDALRALKCKKEEPK